MHLIQYTIVRPGPSQLLTSCCLSLDPLIFLCSVSRGYCHHHLSTLLIIFSVEIHPVHTSPQQHLRTLHRPLLSKLISMHCRHRRFLIVSAALTPNSPSLSSVVGFKAKLEHPGDEPAPKRCAIIQYFLGSKVRYPFGHHKKQR